MTNPYSPPKADVTISPQLVGEAEYQQEASTGQRFANLLLDYVGYMIVSMGLGIMMGIAGGFDWIDGPLGNVFGLVVMFGYYAFFEATLGRTPGKLLTRTRVVDVAGGPASFGQILGRTAARFVPFEPFSFFGSTHGWHDRWSNTRVIRAG
jgi:uncharacterized RDD family membrane protein YckC